MQLKSDELGVKDAAAYLGLTCQYLYQLKHNEKGPKFRKVEITGSGSGPRVRILYKKSDLDIWNAARREKKTKKPKAKSTAKGRASRSTVTAEAA